MKPHARAGSNAEGGADGAADGGAGGGADGGAGWPFTGRFVLAPMEGITHAEFRNLMAEKGGLALVCTEFVRVTQSPLGQAQLARAVVKPQGVPLSVQVMGNDPQRMAEAATRIEASGADVIDINLGCPMPRVVRKGVGAAMLKDPQLLERVLGLMRSATRGLLSAKIRAGFDDATRVVAIAQLVQAAGVDFITVHPRRRCDFYQGIADWRIIHTLKRELNIPVIGNGDVWYAADALRMRAETGCDGVMIGRPALRNPWIFEQIADLERGRAPRRPDGALVAEHLRSVITRYQERRVRRSQNLLGPLKEMLNWLARAVPEGAQRLRPALRLQSTEALLAFADRFFTPLSAQQLDLTAEGHLQLERSGSARASQEEPLPASEEPPLGAPEAPLRAAC